jgi:hypothetical protein
MKAISKLSSGGNILSKGIGGNRCGKNYIQEILLFIRRTNYYYTNQS